MSRRVRFSVCVALHVALHTAYRYRVDIEAVIAALGEHYDADETAVIERVPRQYGGTVPDQQLIEEVGLALASLRRGGR